MAIENSIIGLSINYIPTKIKVVSFNLPYDVEHQHLKIMKYIKGDVLLKLSDSELLCSKKKNGIDCTFKATHLYIDKFIKMEPLCWYCSFEHKN